MNYKKQVKLVSFLETNWLVRKEPLLYFRIVYKGYLLSTEKQKHGLNFELCMMCTYDKNLVLS